MYFLINQRNIAGISYRNFQRFGYQEPISRSNAGRGGGWATIQQVGGLGCVKGFFIFPTQQFN